jgi:hypothetical protein
MSYDYKIDVDDYNRLVALVEKKIVEDERLAKMYELCAGALKSYQGKVINARIEKAFNLVNYKSRYGKHYDTPSLYISREVVSESGEKHTTDHYQIDLCDKSKDHQKFDVEYLKSKAKALKEQVAKDRQKAANICEIVNKYNSALQWFKSAKDDLHCIPHFYDWSKYF